MIWPIIPVGETFTLPEQASWRAHCRTVPALRISEAEPRHRTGADWGLEAPGVYYWNKKAEHGLVLAYPADAFARVRMAFDVVVASTFYLNGPHDMTAFNADMPGYTQSMLTRPRVSDLGCGQRAHAMVYILAEMGLNARVIQWIGAQPVQGGHIGLEVDLGGEWGWTAVDPFYGMIYRPGWDVLKVFQTVQTGVDPARLMWHYESTLEGRNWSRDLPAESMYAEYAGAVGWGTLSGQTTYPLYLGAGVTLEQVAAIGGISEPVEYTEEQIRETWYA